MRVFISLGDLSAANYLFAIFREGFEDFELIGITDARLESIGVRSVARIEDISVVGIVEVLPRIPTLLRVLRRSKEVLKGCDALIACDAPAFNLRLVKFARDAGVKRIIYFISPQVWAWKPGRARFIADACDHLIVILPFEVELYRPYQGREFKVHYLGHPLVDLVRPGSDPETFRSEVGVEGEFLTLMPGSRWSEIRRHVPLIREAVRPLKIPCVVPTFPTFRGFIGTSLPEARVITEEDVQRPAYTSLVYARCSAVASGTASLEAAVAGSPHAVFYRVNPLTLFLARRIVNVPYISLPNLIAGREVVRELINPRPEDLRRAVADLWEREDIRRVQREAFHEIRKRLGESGVVERLRNLFRDLLSF
ncbi:MAG: lipid-A-disaccharide synthase [Aquificota bacterium]|nr:lipid-A-disaccharide synthase [Aquificota bacterium]